jgi:hypothetical protein
MLDTNLQALQRIHEANNSLVVNQLQHGVALQERHKLPNGFEDLAHCESLQAIFKWHNGTQIVDSKPVEQFYLFPEFYFLSLEEIAAIVDGDEVYHFKLRRQLPLFATGHGEYLTIGLDDLKHDTQSAMIFYACTWDSERELFTEAYDNLFKLFDTILRCFENGAYFFENGVVEMDFDKRRETILDINSRAIKNWK